MLDIKYANWLEHRAKNIKARRSKKYYVQVLKKYSLQDAEKTYKEDVRFNPYEMTDFFLIDQLVKSGLLKSSDVILDVGCGAGLFLAYLAINGFSNLIGIEINSTLFEVALCNAASIKRQSGVNINLVNSNALDYNIPDNVNCFYLFNTFYDKTTYMLWLEKVEESLKRRKRKIKIVILFPTVASMGAMREKNWLKEKGRVVSKSQTCSRCMNFLIYESYNLII